MEFVKWENTLDSREKEKKVFFWRKGKCASYFDRFFFQPVHTQHPAPSSSLWFVALAVVWGWNKKFIRRDNYSDFFRQRIRLLGSVAAGRPCAVPTDAFIDPYTPPFLLSAPSSDLSLLHLGSIPRVWVNIPESQSSSVARSICRACPPLSPFFFQQLIWMRGRLCRRNKRPLNLSLLCLLWGFKMCESTGAPSLGRREFIRFRYEGRRSHHTHTVDVIVPVGEKRERPWGAFGVGAVEAAAAGVAAISKPVGCQPA